MLKTNYRCVQSLNISVDVAKCVENVQKFTQFTHFLSVTKNDLSWLNNLFMAKFQLISMSSYAKNKLQMCSVAQHQCRRCQMCGKCSHINSLHSLLDCYKKRLVFTEQSIHWKFQVIGCPLMLKTNYRCVQSLNISVDVAKCVENVHKFKVHSCTCPDWTNLFKANFQLTRMSSYAKNKLQMCSVTQHQVDVAKCVENVPWIHYTHFWTVTKKDLWSLNNLFMAKFQLMRMSSYAKNKLQICSVTQHQWRRRQMCGKCSQIHPVHSLFVRYRLLLLLKIEQSIHGMFTNFRIQVLC